MEASRKGVMEVMRRGSVMEVVSWKASRKRCVMEAMRHGKRHGKCVMEASWTRCNGSVVEKVTWK